MASSSPAISHNGDSVECSEHISYLNGNAKVFTCISINESISENRLEYHEHESHLDGFIKALAYIFSNGSIHIYKTIELYIVNYIADYACRNDVYYISGLEITKGGFEFKSQEYKVVFDDGGHTGLFCHI